MIRRTAKLLGWTLGGAAVLVTAAGGLFVWRLTEGPIALDPLIPQVERALSDPDGRFTVHVGDLVLSLADEEEVNEAGAGPRRLDLRARRVRAVNAEGRELAAVPEMGVGFSVPALFLGKLSPTRLDLVRPRLNAVRRADGSISFDIRTGEAPPEAETAAGPTLADDLLELLRQPPDIGKPMGLLRSLSITGADLSVTNRMLDISWHARRLDLALTRDAQGTRGRARLTLDLAQGPDAPPVTMEATADHRMGERTTTVTTRFGGLEPAALAALGPRLAPLAGLRVPLGGTVEARLDERFEPETLAFDLQGAPGTATIPELRPEPYAVAGLSARGTLDVAGQRAELAALSLRLRDAAGGELLTLGATGTLREGGEGLAGGGRLTLATPGRSAAVELEGAEDRDRRATLSLRLANLEPAAFAGLAPVLAPLAAAALPLSGTASLTLSAPAPEGGRQPLAVAADLTAGAGRIVERSLSGGQPQPVASAALRLAGDRASGVLAVDRFALALGTAEAPGPRLEGRAQAADRGGQLAAEATVTAKSVPLDDLHRYWPEPVGPNAREWVTKNLRHGLVTEATATVSLAGPLDNLAAIDATRLEAVIRGENVTADYFHPLPPVTGVGVEATTDGKTFTIRTRGGQIGDIRVGDADMAIRGLDIGKEEMEIQVPVSGPIRSILTVLDSPPLGYPSKLDLDPKRTQGTGEAMLRFNFPLLADLKTEDLKLTVNGRLKGAAVEKVAAGMNATDGDLALALDLGGMSVKGTTKLDGIPVSVDWKEQFSSAAKGPRTRIAVKGDVDAADLRSHGIDLEEHVLGPMGADMIFTIDQRHRFALTAALNLEKTRLSIPELGWEKPPGVPGSGKLALEFDKDRPTRVSGLTVDAGGLKGLANIELADGGKRVARVVVPRLQAGASDLQIDVAVRPEGGGYAGTIRGASLDARGLMGGGKGGKSRKGADRPGLGEEGRMTPLDLDVRLGRVVFGEGRQLSQVAGTLRRGPTAWTLLDVTGHSGQVPVVLRYRPDAKGVYQVAIQTDDLGTTLRALDLNDRVQGGRLRVTGHTVAPRADAAIEGAVEIADYTLIDPPVLARILNAASPAGFAELMGGGKGIQFGRLSAGYRKEGRLLTLRDLRTSGSALGLTLEGDIDIQTETANLRGTIVPVYGLNRLIGQIPLLGDLLSGGEGQGIFSATWRVQGPLADPDVSVNPLAVLAPGFLRNLFFLGEGGSGDAPAPMLRDEHLR
ncbi:DUF3971 domain-containing protein [Azospirillum thermophilum]|uniref:YhdP central domain-containing protein n=1 Tax=Azospirillum thermophilum TaxID=2202148 RepID=A0A2S2CPW1_9PROT|nr:DUF3971 domain-containing protein [Azospirillum thermophilum]AWK86489.1 hypothetical protein DEW08_09765 [Azospirillum thermophilum]